MADTNDMYYAKLTRELLAKAEGDLMRAQDYARQANFEDITVKRIQKVINSVRLIADIAGNLSESGKD